jgi:sugar-specific transcriptional regulator TrmB
MTASHIAEILILLCVLWIAQAVSQNDNVIVTKIEELDEKMDALQEKLEEIESKLDERSRPYINPIDL